MIDRETQSVLSVTVVIPLYNGTEFIMDALKSVERQTLAPAEVIVVDDGSTDDGPRLVADAIATYPWKLTLITQANAGQSAARNHGIRLANTQLVALLDQDDMWYPRHLEVLSAPFSAQSNLGFVYSNLDDVDRNGNMVIKRLLDRYGTHPKMTLFECLSQDMFILPSATVLRKEAWEEVGGFDERLCGYEDDDLFLRIWRRWDHRYIDEPLSMWRIRPDSTSYTSRMEASRTVYANKLIENFPDNTSQNLYYVRDCIAPRFYSHYFSLYFTALDERDWDKGQYYYRRLSQFSPLIKMGRKSKLKLSLMSNPKRYSRLRTMKSILPSALRTKI